MGSLDFLPSLFSSRRMGSLRRSSDGLMTPSLGSLYGEAYLHHMPSECCILPRKHSASIFFFFCNLHCRIWAVHATFMLIANLISREKGLPNGNPQHLYGDVLGWYLISIFSALNLIGVTLQHLSLNTSAVVSEFAHGSGFQVVLAAV